MFEIEQIAYVKIITCIIEMMYCWLCIRLLTSSSWCLNLSCSAFLNSIPLSLWMTFKQLIFPAQRFRFPRHRLRAHFSSPTAHRQELVGPLLFLRPKFSSGSFQRYVTSSSVDQSFLLSFAFLAASWGRQLGPSVNATFRPEKKRHLVFLLFALGYYLHSDPNERHPIQSWYSPKKNWRAPTSPRS
jgi:hypothetical protein